MTNKVYRYWAVNRPPMYGSVPEGDVSRLTSLAKEYKTSWGQGVYHGWVEYERPMTIREVWTWELIPDDPIEFAHYAFWQYAGRDPDDAAVLEGDYIWAMSEDPQFEQHCPEELLQAVKILAEAQNGSRMGY